MKSDSARALTVINQENLLLLKWTLRSSNQVEHNILVTDLFFSLSMNLIFLSLIFDDILYWTFSLQKCLFLQVLIEHYEIDRILALEVTF